MTLVRFGDQYLELDHKHYELKKKYKKLENKVKALETVAEAAEELRNHWFNTLDLKTLLPEEAKLRKAVENWQRIKGGEG